MVTFCQLNVSKMSSNSELAIGKYLYDKNIKAMMVQESGHWNISTQPYAGYKVFSNDISYNPSKLRGVSLILKEELHPEPITDLASPDFDGVWCQIKLHNKRILLGSMYCRPSEADMTEFRNFLDYVSQVRQYGKKHRFNSLLIYGDFNARNSEWGDHYTNKKGTALSNYLNTEGLTICSPFDLTFTGNGGGSVIDLVLAEGAITNILGRQWIDKETELFTGAPTQGHYPILQSLHERTNEHTLKTVCKDWKKTDWKSWKEQIERETNQLEKSAAPTLNGKQLWENLLHIINEATRIWVPNKIICVHSKPYWADGLSVLQNSAKIARTNYMNRSTPRNKAELTRSVEEFRIGLIKAKNDWIRLRTESLNVKNSQAFWKKYKRVFGAQIDNTVNNLLHNGLLHTTDHDKEELLYNTFFTGKHLDGLPNNQQHDDFVTEEYRKLKDSFCHRRSNCASISQSQDSILNEAVTCSEIKEAIKRQETTDKALDPNSVHPVILKHLGPSAISLLKLIYNWTLVSGVWLWDTSHITFIRKEGKSNYSEPGAYRPITNAPYFGKILERILDSRLKLMIGIHGTIDNCQEGFLKNRSTTRYLFRLLCNLSDVKRKRLTSIVLFLDFQKAFDSVHLPTLIVKLYKMGVDGCFLNLIHNFLFKRRVHLKVNGYVGKARPCLNFGLPQGSVLAPFLFILYVTDMLNDFPLELKTSVSCYKFADDGTLMVCHENLQECYRLMQDICNHLSIWCTKNKLAINCQPNKTEAMILKTTNSTNGHSIPELTISGKHIKYVKPTKVLGLILDEDLSFKVHAMKKLNDCRKKWGLLTKSTNRNYGLNVKSLTTLLKVVVLTKLMYGAPLWLARNLDVFKGFWNDIIMKITGAMFNPHRDLTEIALHLPPLDVQLEILSVKFMAKCLTTNDYMKSLLLQAEGSLQKQLQDQLTALKKFIAWKKEPGRIRSRQIDLLEPSNQALAIYSKSEIKEFKMFLWTERIILKMQFKKLVSETDEVVFSLITLLQSQKCILDKNNFLFNYGTTKAEDSYIFDYIHGNSLIFGNSRATHLGEENKCLFCQEKYDSQQHQLLECKEVEDDSHSMFQSCIRSNKKYLLEVLSSNRYEAKQTAFIERVKFLKGQHEFLIEEKLEKRWRLP